MTTSDANHPAGSTNHPLATEFVFIIGAMAVFSLLHRVVSTASSWLLDLAPLPDGLLAEGLLLSTTLLAGVGLFTGAYAKRRGIEADVTLPTSDDLPFVGLALLVPAALVGLTKLVGNLTGTPYNLLTKTAVAPNASIEPLLVLTGLGLFVAVPSYLLLCQIVVQGSFERVVGGDVAVALTTLVTGFLLTNSSGGLSVFPDRGKLVGAVVFALAIGVALYAPNHFDQRRWVQYLAPLPALVLFTAFVVSGIAAVESLAGVLFVLTQLAVLALAAGTYQRTRSLVLPALAYLSLSVTSNVVVFVFEAGMQSW